MQPKLAKYEILGGLATGGMADVWLARARGLGGFEKIVVLKTIRSILVKEPGFVEMFFQEARIAARLNHANCVQIFDVGQEGDTPYIAMEFIEGFSLARLVKRTSNGIPMPIVARILMDTASGLDYAHRLTDRTGRPLGLVHRDVSPDNILISFGGQTKVVDFGIVKAAESDGHKALTATGLIKGKLGYMAPEYLKSLPIDGRADLFALGVVLYRTLTGTKPFQGANEIDITNAVMERDPAPPRSINPAIPQPVEDLVLRALAKQPEHRFENARAFRSALEQAVGHPAGTEQVADLMEMMWPPTDPERLGMQQLMSGGSDPSMTLLEPLVSEDVSLGSVAANAGSARPPEGNTRNVEGGSVTANARGVAGAVTSSQQRRRRRTILAAGLGIAIATGSLLGWGGWLLSTRQPAAAPSVGGVSANVAVAEPKGAARVGASAPEVTPLSAPPPRLASQESSPPSLSTITRRPGPPKPRPTATPRTGRLEIATAVSADVLFQSKRVGRAPGIFDLPVGPVSLRFVNREEAFDRELSVTLLAGVTTHLTVEARKAWLSIDSMPRADVKLDGRAMGSTPLSERQVFEGRHVIELSSQGTGKTRHVTVELVAGEHKSVVETLE